MLGTQWRGPAGTVPAQALAGRGADRFGKKKVGMARGNAGGAQCCTSDLLSLSRLLRMCEVELVLLDGNGPGATVHRAFHEQALCGTIRTGFSSRGRFTLPPDWRLLACVQETDESASWCQGAPLSNASVLTLGPGATSDFVLSAGSAITWVMAPLQGVRRPADGQLGASTPGSGHLQLPDAHPLLQRYAGLGERIAAGHAALADLSLGELLAQHDQCMADAGPHGRVVSGRGRGTHYRMLRRAEDFMRKNLRHNLYMNEICAAAGVSERALRYAFDDLLGMSPNRYLSMLRLCTASLGLASADAQRTSVKAVALSCGLWDLSRFAENYRRVFGELPRETLMRQAD